MRFVLVALYTWPIWVSVMWGHDAQPFMLGLIAWATINARAS